MYVQNTQILYTLPNKAISKLCPNKVITEFKLTNVIITSNLKQHDRMINKIEPMDGPNRHVQKGNRGHCVQGLFTPTKTHTTTHLDTLYTIFLLGQWVFGGIEVKTGKIFMIPVEKRDATTAPNYSGLDPSGNYNCE